MPTLKIPNDPVNLAFAEIEAISTKYNLQGIVVITTKDSLVVRSDTLGLKQMNAVENTESELNKMFSNTSIIIQRTMRLIYRHILKTDVLLQLITRDDKEGFSETYSEIEKSLELNIDEIASTVQAAGVEAKDVALATLDNTPGLITASPRTVNKLRQINNAFIGNYFGPK